MSGNGFDEHKLLYEERFKVNEQQHRDIIKALDELRREVSNLTDISKKHSAWWAAFWGGVLLSINLFAPLLFGGCNG